MKRDLTQLANNTYDVLVIGGGIHGACVAWDAALRGLSVALIDKGDFGHATSSNSLKTVHGGLRYLQDADLKLVRTMIHERMSLLRIAPHLVHPLPVLMPTYKKLMKSKPVMAAALALNDLICLDRNRLPDPQKRLPRSRIISKQECLQILPGLAGKDLTGGAIWHDAQMYNSERLTLSFVLAAAQTGAAVANYVEAVRFLKNKNRITGIQARDGLTGNDFDIRAGIVVNTAGPWVNHVLGFLNGQAPSQKVQLSIAMNLVTRQLIPTYAAGVPSWPDGSGQNGRAKKSRMLFIAPWRDYSLIGTIHLPYAGHPDNYQVGEADIQAFIDEINSAYPGAALTQDDVRFVHWGFLPAKNSPHRAGEVKLVRRGQVCDHQKEDGIEGLVTVVGVKYTSARNVAQQAVDVVLAKLGKQAGTCRTHETPIYGGQIDRFDDFLRQETASRPPQLTPAIMRHLIYNYGAEYRRVLAYLKEDPGWGRPLTPTSDIIKAEILHAIRVEMAQKLADVILRRTELGSAGWPGETALQICAGIMAAELGWDACKKEREINDVRAVYRLKALRGA